MATPHPSVSDLMYSPCVIWLRGHAGIGDGMRYMDLGKWGIRCLGLPKAMEALQFGVQNSKHRTHEVGDSYVVVEITSQNDGEVITPERRERFRDASGVLIFMADVIRASGNTRVMGET